MSEQVHASSLVRLEEYVVWRCVSCAEGFETQTEGLVHASKCRVEIDHLRSLLAECQAVLEFYGDRESYSEEYTDPAGGSHQVYAICEIEAGKQAREMLAKLKEMK